MGSFINSGSRYASPARYESLKEESKADYTKVMKTGQMREGEMGRGGFPLALTYIEDPK